MLEPTITYVRIFHFAGLSMFPHAGAIRQLKLAFVCLIIIMSYHK